MTRLTIIIIYLCYFNCFSEGKRTEAANNSASDDESGNDNASEWSNPSEARSVQDEGGKYKSTIKNSRLQTKSVLALEYNKRMLVLVCNRQSPQRKKKENT